MFGLNINFDRLSFWLGFLAATLFWWIFKRLKTQFPAVKLAIKEFSATLRRNRLIDVYQSLAKATLIDSQNSHLARQLFPLSEIIIQPRLIATPPLIDPNDNQIGNHIIHQILPYTPDWPEIGSAYNVPSITLAEAIASYPRIALIGPPGCGKTTTLAHLASSIARQENLPTKLIGCHAAFLHISDFDLEQTDQEPLKQITGALSPKIPVLLTPRLVEAIRLSIDTDQFILLIDGFDELHPSQLDFAKSFLDTLLTSFPKIRIGICIDPDNCRGFKKLGFKFYPVKTWNSEDKEEFIKNWNVAWENKILSDVKKSQHESIDLHLIKNWLFRPGFHCSPFEWTLITWAAFSGDMLSPTPNHAIQAYIARVLPEKYFTSLKDFSKFIVERKSAFIGDTNKNLVNSSSSASKNIEIISSDINNLSTKQTPKNTETSSPSSNLSKISKDVLNHDDAFDQIEKTGIFITNHRNVTRICHPIIAGYLISLLPEQVINKFTVEDMSWNIGFLSLRYLFARNSFPEWISSLLALQEKPVFNISLKLARWLPEINPNHPFRNYVLKRIVGLIISDEVQFSIRLRLLLSVVFSNDLSAYKLVKQLSNHPSSEIKRLACLAYPLLSDEHIIEDLGLILQASDPEVQNAACLAMTALSGDKALKACVDIITTKDEVLRRIIAESLSNGRGEKQELLKELAEVDDLLVRRAVVFGLGKIREDWARKLLEKMAVQDSQWVVRNAAAGALEIWDQPSNYLPQPIPPASEAGWLVAFASKHGEVLPKNIFPKPMLIRVSREGTPFEKVQAIEYLSEDLSRDTIQEINRLLTDPNLQVRETALAALWSMQAEGISLDPVLR